MFHVGLAQAIASEVADLTYDEAAGGNVFIDELPTMPDRAIAVFATGGTEADSLLPYDAPTAQVVIRGDADPRWALDTWSAIYSAIHARRQEALPDGTYLIYALVQQSSPVRLGRDTNGRMQYAMNVRAEVTSVTEERPA